MILGDIAKVFSANMLAVLTGLVTGFFVPRFLGTEQYAAYKTFGLYATYVGVLHFGFIDGLFLKYGGIEPARIDKGAFRSEFLFLLFTQASMTFLCAFAAFLLKNWLLLPVALLILPANLITFYKFFYQATGQFNRYARLNVLQPIFFLFAVLFLVFFVRTPRASLFITSQVLIIAGVACLLAAWGAADLRKEVYARILSKENFKLISVGFFIMVGNLSGILFYSLDRWFVKIFLSTTDFAFYSLAVSMMGMVLVIVNSVSMTLYHRIAKQAEDLRFASRVKRYLVMLGVFSAGGFFAFDIVIPIILPDYVPALGVISLLFAGFPAIAVINGLFINLYKAKKREKHYFAVVLSMLFVSFLLNCVAVLLRPSGTAIALATLFSFNAWYIIDTFRLEGIKGLGRELLPLSVFLVVFLSLSRLSGGISGFFFYGIFFLVWVAVFYRAEAKEIFKTIKTTRSSSNA